MKSNLRNWLKTRRGRQATWAAIALTGYALAGFLVAPWILGKLVPKYAGDFLGRKVTIEKVRINPFVLSGSFRGLNVEEADGTPLLSWSEVYGNFQLSSIFHWAFTFKEVRVVDPYIHVQINPDYTLNISDIVGKLQPQSAEGSSEESSGIPSMRLQRVIITNAIAQFSDLTLREPFHRQIGPVDLAVDRLYTHPDSENPYSIAGSTEAGERFAWSGHFFLFPLRSQGRLSLENVAIANYAPFYQDFVSLSVDDGIVDLGAEYDLVYGPTDRHLRVTNAMAHLAGLEVRAEVDETDNALTVGDLRVSGVNAELWSRTARVGLVSLKGGKLMVRREQDASINLLEMTQPSVTNAEPAGAVLYAMRAATNLISTFLSTTNQAVARIDSLEVQDWTLQIEDRTPTRTVQLSLDQIEVQGRNLSNVPGEDLSLSVGCRWNTNGTVNVEVDARLFPVHSDVRIQINDIELPPLDPYAEPFASVLLLDSKFSLDGVAHIRRQAMGAPFDVAFEGDLRWDDLSSREGTMGSDLLEWSSVELSGLQANLHPLQVNLQQLGIYDARARLTVETNRTINVLNAINVADSNVSATLPGMSQERPATRAPADDEDSLFGPLNALGLPEITISSVLISNAALHVLDASTTPPLRWSVTQVDGRITGLSSTNAQRADLRLTAKAGGTAPVVVVGKLNPLDPTADTDIDIRLDGMDLLPFDPYSGRYAGYRLRKGGMSLGLEYKVRGRKLDSENLIVVDQLALGQKVSSPEATKLPVKLGVAVLKDRRGVIELDIPIEGDLDDPEFRLGRVIGRTIMITLTKMLSSPFSLLGGIAGGTGEELSAFEFAPGSSRIRPGETNDLHKLSVALYERPGLEVELQGSVHPDADGLAIRKQKLTRLLQQIRWEELRESARASTRPEEIILSPDIRIAMLRKYYVQVFPDKARSSKAPPGLEETFYENMTNRLLDQIEVDEEDYRQLANARAAAIKAWLVDKGEVEPGRLFHTSGENATSRQGSRVTLQLQ